MAEDHEPETVATVGRDREAELLHLADQATAALADIAADLSAIRTAVERGTGR